MDNLDTQKVLDNLLSEHYRIGSSDNTPYKPLKDYYVESKTHENVNL